MDEVSSARAKCAAWRVDFEETLWHTLAQWRRLATRLGLSRSDCISRTVWNWSDEHRARTLCSEYWAII